MSTLPKHQRFPQSAVSRMEQLRAFESAPFDPVPNALCPRDAAMVTLLDLRDRMRDLTDDASAALEGLAKEAAVQAQPKFADEERAALLWVLYHFQGGSSPVGQPIRAALGLGQHDHLSDSQIAVAKGWGEANQRSTVDFHSHLMRDDVIASLQREIDDLKRQLREALPPLAPEIF